jgi:hypothetical protein
MPYEMLTGRRAFGGKANCVSKTRDIGTSPFEWRTWSIVPKNHDLVVLDQSGAELWHAR